MARRLLVAAVIVLVAGALVSCDDDTTTLIEPAPTGTVTFQFDNTIDGAPLSMNQLIYTNARGTKYSVSTLQYVVSDITLHQDNGRTWGMDGIHYRDHTNAATESVTLGGVPAGTYTMISFTFGLDASKNVKNQYLNEPNDFHVAMEWPAAMGGDQGLGYHYMKLEGNFEDTPGGTTSGYTTHAGARWLADGNPMTGVEDPLPYHHFFRVYLPIAATAINGNEWRVTITADMNGWYEDATPSDSFDSEYDWHDLAAQMIMANLAAQEKLMVNGPHCFAAAIAAAP